MDAIWTRIWWVRPVSSLSVIATSPDWKKSMIMSNCCLIFPDNADECKEDQQQFSFSDDSPGPASEVNLRYARHQAYLQAKYRIQRQDIACEFARRFYRLKP